MLKPIIYLSLSYSLLCCSSLPDQQEKKQNEPQLISVCDGCEFIFEYNQEQLASTDTLPGFYEEGVKIKISGRIFQSDGKTPAEGVILYVYHTNQEGKYENRFNRNDGEKKHGYMRGWVKTGADGKYAFFTIKPGVYPSRDNPAHIHPTILEPNGKYYWLGAYHFEGDSLLTEKEISPENPRGGSSGMLTLRQEGDLWVGERDLILGKNIEGYE